MNSFKVGDKVKIVDEIGLVKRCSELTRQHWSPAYNDVLTIRYLFNDMLCVIAVDKTWMPLSVMLPYIDYYDLFTEDMFEYV